jgi:general secretion pathway protein G
MSCEQLANESRRERLVRPDDRAAATEASRRHKHGRCRNAFSLVELMVVMVIMGMLVGLAAVRYRSYLISSKQSTARTQIATMVKAIETFYAQEGRYPTTEEGIEILAEGTTTWPDGYLDRVPLDPWKLPYEYMSPGSTQPYEVICLGADGREGGEGENSDISSEALTGDAQE